MWHLQFSTTSQLGQAVETDNEKLKTRLLHFVRKDYLLESEAFCSIMKKY